MPKPSSMNERDQRTNEKLDLVAEESQLEPALPPPPSLDPSSSSSVLPPTFNHPSLLNGTSASSTSGDPIASQIAQLFSLVGRLSSENEAHLNSFARVDVELASSKSENQALGRTVKDQDRVIAELSRAAILDGHWVWETEMDQVERAKGKDGRWLFSLEKYKPNPPQLASGPSASLLSLPVELTDLIFSLLFRSDVLAVCLVSFGLLQRASARIYPINLELDYGTSEMYLFVSSRVVGTSNISDRISNVLLPRHLILDHWSPPDKKNKVVAASVLEGVKGRGQIALHGIILASNPINPSFSLRSMLPILAYFNPRELQIGCFRPDDEAKVKRRVPTVLPVTKDELTFLHHWTRLDEFVGVGFASVPVFSENGGTLALLECLLKRTTKGKVRTRLTTWTPESASSETVSDTQLVSSLNQTNPSEPLIEEIYLIADLVPSGASR